MKNDIKNDTGNELDELTGPTNAEGLDSKVIHKQLKIKLGPLTEIFCKCQGILILGIAIGFIVFTQGNDLIVAIISSLTLPALYFLLKVQAKSYFQQLQQKIQADASTIDNYLEQRVIILQNVASIMAKAIDLDKDVMKSVAALRGGGSIGEEGRNLQAKNIDTAFARLFPQVEAYPDLKAHASIADAMQQNSYLQKEITAARSLYNDSINQWNTDVFCWPIKMIVASESGYTTKIPFTTTESFKETARSVLL